MDNKIYNNLTKEKLDEVINEVFNRKDIKLAFDSFNVFYSNLSAEGKEAFNIEFKKQAKAFISEVRYIPINVKDGKQCSECDVRYEKPHWVEVLCVDCFETYLKNGIKPDLPKASGVEL